MNNECPRCHEAELKFNHTDYYDFDVFICPACGYEDRVPQDFWLDDESLMAAYGDDYFDNDNYGDDE